MLKVTAFVIIYSLTLIAINKLIETKSDIIHFCLISLHLKDQSIRWFKIIGEAGFIGNKKNS